MPFEEVVSAHDEEAVNANREEAVSAILKVPRTRCYQSLKKSPDQGARVKPLWTRVLSLNSGNAVGDKY